VHAWIYRLDDGLLRDLQFNVDHPNEVDTALAQATAR